MSNVENLARYVDREEKIWVELFLVFGEALKTTDLSAMLLPNKFFCRNPNCPRKVFAERLPDFICTLTHMFTQGG